MEAILGGMIEGVLVVNEQGRVQLVNAAARRMLRLQGTVEGRHYLEIIRHPDVAARLGATLARQHHRGPRAGRCRASPTAASSRAAPRSCPRMRAGAVLVLHDITELRQADRVRRDFVANVSHELRTPLTAVRGYVEALAR